MEKIKLKEGMIYKLDWDLIIERDYFCECGGSFLEIAKLTDKNKLFARLETIEEQHERVKVFLYSKEESYYDWWLNPKKLIPIKNSVKKVK